MKKKLKQKLSKAGVYPYVDFVRRLPNVVRWISTGCSGVAPAPVKRRVISAYVDLYGMKKFVETGTHEGDTLAYIARDKSVHCSSVELSEHYYNLAVNRFSNYANVELFSGDSGSILPQIVNGLNCPAIFWLDGHYSGGKTARGESDTPVSSELRAILDSPIKQHVILIDDARLFDGTAGYPDLGTLLTSVKEHGQYDMEVTTDIIRLTPRTTSNET